MGNQREYNSAGVNFKIPDLKYDGLENKYTPNRALISLMILLGWLL
jgi:hypothetical protein